MSIKVMSQVWERQDLDPYERLVMLCLADHADDEGACFPSIARLCTRTGMKERGVQQVLKRLTEKGLLTIDANAGRKGTNLYRVATPAPDAPPHRTHPRTGRTPACDAPHPRTGRTPTPAPDAPEPSLNRQEPSSSAQATPPRVTRFEEFWSAYPHRNGAKKGKQPALEKYRRAVKAGISEDAIIEGARAAHRHPDVVRGYARDPVTWLNQGGWQDEVGGSAVNAGRYSNVRERYAS